VYCNCFDKKCRENVNLMITGLAMRYMPNGYVALRAYKKQSALGCLKDINISSMDESVLKSHARGEKPGQLADEGVRIKVNNLLRPIKVETVPMQLERPRETQALDDSMGYGNIGINNVNSSCLAPDKSSGAPSFTIGNDILSAEIMWALKLCVYLICHIFQ
jgi:hypothetical protein